ncbi:GDSL-type esterase/lipase family protein [Actinospica acidiphila]|uniref:GDSL-type esterase/lipase family protein n=1 Tax=Actinospica acidiphila TaxID=304899 RepID=UPI00355744D6
MAGWGQKIEDFLSGPVTVANYARSAMTTRKYFTERFPAMLNRMKRGDIVLIGFGGVDHMISNGMRHVPVPEYQELLRLFARYIHAEGGVPVLVTPCARYAFAPTGEVVNTRGEYPRAMLEVAAELGAPVIDLTGRTMELWAQIGPTRLRQYFAWVDAGSTRSTRTDRSTPRTSITRAPLRWPVSSCPNCAPSESSIRRTWTSTPS